MDLGTVFSVVARMTPGGAAVVVPDRRGHRKTRSAVLFTGDGPPQVGGTAPNTAAESARLAQFVGCNMGDPTWRFHAPDGTAFRAEEVSAIILRRLKEDAERVLRSEVTDIILTVPACFDDAARRASVDAARIAGLTVRHVLNAPTAAVLAYGRTIAPGSTVLVYVLGGGNFDASVLQVADGAIDVLASRGERALGGLDWDNALLRILNREFRALGGPDLLADPTAEAQLRRRAESAKHGLTKRRQAQVPLAAGGVSRMMSVGRSEFEAATARLLTRTRTITDLVLRDAGLDGSQIHHVLLAGGATRMPMVRAMFNQPVGRLHPRQINPDEVIALGAACASTMASTRRQPALTPRGPRVRDVTSYGLGTIACNSATGARQNVVLIPTNTSLPAGGRAIFTTAEDDQTRIDIEVTEGEGPNPAAVTRLDRRMVRLRPHPAGSPVEIACSCGVDQVRRLEVRDLTTGEELGTFQVRNLAAMSDKQVADAARRIDALASGSA